MSGRFMKLALAGLLVMGAALEATALPIVNFSLSNPFAAKSIEDLEIDGALYDVTFVSASFWIVPVFDGDAAAAVAAINAALNSTGTAKLVSDTYHDIATGNYGVFDSTGGWALVFNTGPANWAVYGAGTSPETRPFSPATFAQMTPVPPAVPEPATLALLGTGLLGVGFARRTRRRFLLTAEAVPTPNTHNRHKGITGIHTMTRSLSRAALALALLLLSTTAFASPITYQFGVTATTGPLTGTSAFGTLTFDSSKIVFGDWVKQRGLFDDLAFTWNGITYDETTVNTGSLQFDRSGYLIGAFFGNNCIFGGSCSVAKGTNQFMLTNGFTYATPGTTDWFKGTTTISPVPAAVPEPASLALLASGLVGMVASARRRRSAPSASSTSARAWSFGRRSSARQRSTT